MCSYFEVLNQNKRQIDNGDNDGVLERVQEKKWAQKTGIWVYIYIQED